MSFIYNWFIQFKGENMHFAFLFVAIIYMVAMGRRKEKVTFLPSLLLLLLTVFNFIFVNIIVSIFDVSDVYYRFFWCIPLIIIVAYFFTVMVFKIKNAWKRVLMLFLIAIVIILSGSPVLTRSNRAQNIYKVPDSLIPIIEFITEDSPIDNPTVAFSYSLNLYARQYDPSILLSLNRDYIIDILGASNVGITDEVRESESYKQQAVIILAIMGGVATDGNILSEALMYTDTMYIVISNDEFVASMLASAGCAHVASIDAYHIYRNSQLYNLRESNEPSGS